MAKKIPSFELSARSFKLAFKPGETVDNEAVNAEIIASVQAHGIKAVLAYDGDRAVTMEELAENGIADDIPEDGKEVIKVLTFDFKEGALVAKAGDAKYPLARAKITVGYKMASPTGGKKLKDDAGKSAYISDVFVVSKSEGVPAAEAG